MSLSPEQLAQRLEGVSGTDIGAICGLSPWKRPIDVWLEKTGRAKPFVGNDRTKWGTLLEPVIRSDYEERHEVRVEVPGTIAHATKPWWLGSPDGIVYKYGRSVPDRGLEIKVHGREAILSGNLQYGAAGTDEVPEHELVQCMWYMGATGIGRWDLVAFLDGAPVEYIIDRDDELLAELEDRAARFMVDNVKANVAPEPDGSDSWDAWLTQRWGKSEEHFVDVNDNEAVRALLTDLRLARYAIDEAAEREKLAEQRVKDVIGGNAGLSWMEPGFKTPRHATWKFSKSKLQTDWQTAYKRVREQAALVVSACATSLANARVALTDMGMGKMADAVNSATDALATIASGNAEKDNTTTVPGPRVFNVPRSWARKEAA